MLSLGDRRTVDGVCLQSAVVQNQLLPSTPDWVFDAEVAVFAIYLHAIISNKRPKMKAVVCAFLS
jgi:hypothetical protein